MASPRSGGAGRFVIGIGVSTYDDAGLNLAAVPDDVAKMTEWFAERSSLPHERALPKLADSPSNAEIQGLLSTWLETRDPEDVVVVYLAAHGGVEGGIAYVQGRDSPRQRLGGRAIDGETLGRIIGQSPPNNVLFIVDACVAGRLGTAIQRHAEDVADDLNTRDPHRKWSQAVLCSTFGRDPAHDGRFVQAFLKVVTEERWTGTSRPFIDFDLLMTGLNQELKDLHVPQVAERKVWGPGAAELIPNPNYGRRQLSTLIADEELASHFDPSSRGVMRGEAGWYFKGRWQELSRIVRWLKAPAGPARSHLFVITGSPGSGKSALISRVVMLSDVRLRERAPHLDGLPRETIPPDSSVTAVVWCHNKTLEQVVIDLGARLGLNARTPSALLYAVGASATTDSPLTIAVDALDEAVEGNATRIASDLIVPLAAVDHVKVLVATRPHPVHSADGDREGRSLLDELHVALGDEQCLMMDEAQNRVADMRAYVVARLLASGESGRTTPYTRNPELAEQLAARVVAAAGSSFLVAAVTARSFAGRAEVVDPAGELGLPTEAGAALASYIDRLTEPRVVVDILRPLAWAEGAGLPWGPMWAPIANALARAVAPEAQVHYDDGTVAAVLDRASDLVVEAIESEEPVYRLFHAALAEHLRGDLAPPAAHAAIATTLDSIVGSAHWENAPAYGLAHLTTHLAQIPGRYQRLYELATSPDWERAKRERFGHSVGFLQDVDLAIKGALAREPQDLASLTGACLVYARQMAVAPAPVIDIVARAGQLQRAELMANNITFAVERCWAYSLLAPTLHAERDVSGAQRCLREAERALAAINVTHAAMAWSWIASAAAACGFRELAVRASRSAAQTLEVLTAEAEWELPNVFFWAGMASRHAGDEETRASLREAFGARIGVLRRNQALQAASVLGATDALRGVWSEWMDGARGGMVRDGNLALALAGAEMMDELRAMLVVIEAGEQEPVGEDDARKRFVWALAMAGRFEWALRYLSSIGDPEHRVRALGRVVSEAAQQRKPEILVEARRVAGMMDSTPDQRVRTRLVPVLYDLQDEDRALLLAEELIREGVEPTALTSVVFPEPDAGQPVRPDEQRGAKKRQGRMRRLKKSARRHLHTDISALDDEKLAEQIVALARDGKQEEALAKFSAIGVPRFRWQALYAIATSARKGIDAVTLWRDALLEARLVNEPTARLTATGLAVLLPLAPGGAAQRERLVNDVRAITKRWTAAAFGEQYEALREFLGSGLGRTQRMEDLFGAAVRALRLGNSDDRVIAAFRLPFEFAERQGEGPSGDPVYVGWRELQWGMFSGELGLWTEVEVRGLVESDGEGKRLFALALMESRIELASLDAVIPLIESSLSAFEQYRALRVVLRIAPTLGVRDRDRLRAMLERERKRFIGQGTDRYELSVQIERALQEKGSGGG